MSLCIPSNWSKTFNEDGWSRCPSSHPLISALNISFPSDGGCYFIIKSAKCCKPTPDSHAIVSYKNVTVPWISGNYRRYLDLLRYLEGVFLEFIFHVNYGCCYLYIYKITDSFYDKLSFVPVIVVVVGNNYCYYYFYYCYYYYYYCYYCYYYYYYCYYYYCYYYYYYYYYYSNTTSTTAILPLYLHHYHDSSLPLKTLLLDTMHYHHNYFNFYHRA